jgi:hypothetical protein
MRHQIELCLQLSTAAIEARATRQTGKEIAMRLPRGNEVRFLVPTTTFAHDGDSQQFGIATGWRWSGVLKIRRHG